jgi:hypothetical protein
MYVYDILLSPVMIELLKQSLTSIKSQGIPGPLTIPGLNEVV